MWFRSLSGMNTQSGSTLTMKSCFHNFPLFMSEPQACMKISVLRYESVFCPFTPYCPMPTAGAGFFQVQTVPQLTLPSAMRTELMTAYWLQPKMLARLLNCSFSKTSSLEPALITEKQNNDGKSVPASSIVASWGALVGLRGALLPVAKKPQVAKPATQAAAVKAPRTWRLTRPFWRHCRASPPCKAPPNRSESSYCNCSTSSSSTKVSSLSAK
mmetsp:Transcript_96182/g.206385  ORF Transcript_96182/g.206385 Transcript_96182/m.206385 type:complete len:214 (+) Transcript_96182:456-1097(+)